MSSVYVLSRLNFGDGAQKGGLHQRSVGTCIFFECRRQRATLDRPPGRIAPICVPEKLWKCYSEFYLS